MKITGNEKFLHQTTAEHPWRQLNVDLNDIKPVSSMIGSDEAFYLHWLAREYYQGLGEIIDGGPLLGGSTMALASGLEKNPRVLDKYNRIHAYDIFVYHKYMARVASRAGLELKEGDSLLPIFQSNTEKYEDFIEVTAGDFLQSQWNGKPVEILFIDLAKSWELNNYVIKEFFGHLIPNQSIVAHQDYFHFHCYWIHLTMQHLSPYFKTVHAPHGGTLAFMLRKEIPKELLTIDYSTYFSKQKSIELMDAALAPWQGPRSLRIMTTKVRLLTSLEEYDAANALVKEIRSSDDWVDWLLKDIRSAQATIPADYRDDVLLLL